MVGIRKLRTMAVGASLFAPASLDVAVRRIGFVQYDPIRSPAPAQDLIMHQRVTGYRLGDLERGYRRLRLEEDRFHVYGAMTRDLMRLLHPRPDRRRPGRTYSPVGLVAEVLTFVRDRGPTHPSDLKTRFGRTRKLNAWGGFSSATTHALEELHYYGLVRVAWRDNGTKVYEPCVPPRQRLSTRTRLRQLTLRIVEILGPIPEPSLRRALIQLRASIGLSVAGSLIGRLLKSGEIESAVVDGVRYLWASATLTASPREVPRRVRFVAPFDSVVWDRCRFEHLWGWAYRFEAYTPKAKRRFGYYALPLLFGDRAIGWVNCRVAADGTLDVEPSFVERAPRSRDFKYSYEREVAHLEMMLRRADRDV